jgi:hypothetical protein
MQEEHVKKLRRGSSGKTQTGREYSIWSNKLHNQSNSVHSIAWNVDYIKFTGGEAWLMDGMHRVEM